jgi:hypothetical protein
VRYIPEDSEILISKFRRETDVFRAVTIKITALILQKFSNTGEVLTLIGRSGYSQKIFAVKRDG